MPAIGGTCSSIGCRRSTPSRRQSSSGALAPARAEGRWRASSGVPLFLGGFEECRDLLPELLLNLLDGAPGIDVSEMELIGHRSVLTEQLALVGAEAVVDVVA